MKTPKKRYQEQKDAAKQRGIEFNISFDEWWSIWEQSGKYEQRGCRRGQYVMSRVNDTGPYEVGNVFIQTCGGNNSDGHRGKTNPKKGPKDGKLYDRNKLLWSLERRKQHSDRLKGRKQPTSYCETCDKEISKNNFSRHKCRASILL